MFLGRCFLLQTHLNVSARAGGKPPEKLLLWQSASDSSLVGETRPDYFVFRDKTCFAGIHLVHCLVSHLFQVSLAGTGAVNQGPQSRRAAVPFAPIANRQEQLPLQLKIQYENGRTHGVFRMQGGGREEEGSGLAREMHCCNTLLTYASRH